ncbi:MAG: amidohydrolase family protein [Acidimicrobiales bacterium]
MIDLAIRNVTIVDGNGTPGYVGDVGVDRGRVCAVGTVVDDATEEVDGTGLVVCPGFIDPHTHFDAQLLWDPYASPSNLHGITTVISGNCGFTLAPMRPEDAGWTLEMMAEVEGMPLAALKAGVTGSWTTFPEYLERVDGRLGVNAGFLVGHCQLRRYVMGADGDREATPTEVAAMAAELRASLAAGGLGFSSTQSFSHNDGDGKPVPSRNATTAELLELCEVVADYEGTTLEYITDGCLNGFTDEEVERITEMSRRGKRAVNWNVLTVDSRDPDSVERQLRASRFAADHGGRVVALTMPILVPMNMSLLTRCALTLIPGWDEILTQPLDRRMELLRDPAVRDRMRVDADSESAGVFRRLNRWAEYHIGDTYTAENKALEGRRVGDIAAERGVDPFDALIDIALVDGLRTVLWPTPLEDDDDSWRLRMELLDSGRAMVGGSDGGAHLDRMMGSVYPTKFLGDTIRGRRLVTLERAVQMMTSTPAELFGLRDRGRIAVGYHADLVLFDPATVDSAPIRKIADLPADSERLFADAIGVHQVLVNGVAIVRDNIPTGASPGALLRSGRDTRTVPVDAAS